MRTRRKGGMMLGAGASGFLVGFVVTLVILLVLGACATVGETPQRPCQTVYVDNRGFEDVSIYVDGGRIGWVGGLGTRALRMCRSLSSPLVFGIRKLGGGGYSVEYADAPPLAGDEIQLVLAFFPNYSYAIPKEN